MKTMTALKAIAAIGAAIVLALLTVQGTLALWNATATSEKQTVQAADFKVSVAVDGGPEQRLPADGVVKAIVPSGLTPGTSKVTPIVVNNATDAGGSFTISATASRPVVSGQLAPYLETSIGLDQNGKCTSVESGPMYLAKGASGTFCLTTTLKSGTPSAMSGTDASIAFTLTAAQQSR